MTKPLPILCLFVASFGVQAHDWQISLFELGSTSDGHVDMFVRLDKEDFLEELYDLCDDYAQVETCVEKYINEHFSLSTEGREIYFKVEELSHSAEFVEINFISAEPFEAVESLELFNDVLIDAKPSQENIVRISFFDQNRSFRMNKDRTSTTISYNL